MLQPRHSPRLLEDQEMLACWSSRLPLQQKPSLPSRVNPTRRRVWHCNRRVHTPHIVHPTLYPQLHRTREGFLHKGRRPAPTPLLRWISKDNHHTELQGQSRQPWVKRRSGHLGVYTPWLHASERSSSSTLTFITHRAWKISGFVSSANMRVSLAVPRRLLFGSTRSRIARSGSDWQRRRDY